MLKPTSVLEHDSEFGGDGMGGHNISGCWLQSPAGKLHHLFGLDDPEPFLFNYENVVPIFSMTNYKLTETS